MRAERAETPGGFGGSLSGMQVMYCYTISGCAVEKGLDKKEKYKI